MSRRIAPPRHLEELRIRAEALDGHTLGEIAAALEFSLAGSAVRTKGRAGELVERALGASAGSAAAPDFPSLGVELKTIPIDTAGRPRESTFVCSLGLEDADGATWEASTVRAKLSHVLWVPLLAGGTLAERRVERPRLWRPTAPQEAILRADFEELVGQIGAGGVEQLSAHAGRWLQVRPKAADGDVRTDAPAFDGEPIETVPRGFYLRTRFTRAILVDAAAIPD